MTFSNRREPTFGGAHTAPEDARTGGAHNSPHIGSGDVLAHKVAKASGLTRMVSSVQIIGSLLAVPLGLASGYSMYKTTFAVDTTCQNLRGNIVAMLDKNVDAATRRMLVRRDISTFEQTCGSFDPDAQAAFKALLAVPAAPAATATAAPKLRSALPATEVARKDVKPEGKAEAKAEAKLEAKVESKPEPKQESKNEPRPAVAEKAPAIVPQAAIAPQAASLESIEREAAVSDTRWLAAVRQALVTNNPEAAAPAKASEPAHLEAPAAKAVKPETLAVAKPAAPAVQLQPTWNVPAQTAPAPVAAVPAETVAPALGAPTDVAPAVAAAPALAAPAPAADSPSRILNVTTVRDDAPRPPAAITGPTPINGPTESDDSTTSRIGSWIAQIPLVGRVIEPRQ